MAPFTSRQVGYIKAIAGVGQHKSFKTYNNEVTLTGACFDSEGIDQNKFWVQPASSLHTVLESENVTVTDKKLGAVVFTIDNTPRTIDHTDGTDIVNMVFNRDKFDGAFGAVHPMGLLTMAQIDEGQETKNYSTHRRVGEDLYLESTHIRWRFTMPDFTVASGKQPHHEYRWIVFRQRKPTLGVGVDDTKGEVSYLNWNYDLFNGFQGRPVGPAGHRRREQFDGTEAYISGAEAVYYTLGDGECVHNPKLTADDLMTLPVNEADYVVMRDERFFLGAEHGKSHYETVTRFDWSDAGSTNNARMIEGLDEAKNYRWFFLLIGTTNDSVQPALNVSCRGTTAITSA